METWKKRISASSHKESEDRFMADRNTFYIAYGSNLNVEQMQHRCPTATVYGKGKIMDYRLTFKTMGACAYATIEPCEGDYVPVAVWCIQGKDEKSLDRYEGYPLHYKKGTVKVVLDYETIIGMVYIMNHKAVYALPDRRYFSSVESGYQSFGLDKSKLHRAWCRIETGYDGCSEILRFYRRKIGLTQIQLAEQTGIPVRSIQKYESGERMLEKAHADAVLRLADVLGISPYLLA